MHLMLRIRWTKIEFFVFWKMRFESVLLSFFSVNTEPLILLYVSHKYGGAYATYSYARRKNKRIYNISKSFETV